MAAAWRLSRLLRHLSTQSAAAPAETFRAWVVNAEKGSLKHRAIDSFAACAQLPQQDPVANVTVNVHFSDLNYKDAMILQGQHGVVRKFPIVPGIDLSGVVVESHSPLWKPGDEVVLTGNKIGQHFDGGYSEFCRVQAEWLVAKPSAFTMEECMMIGTAGFTAMQMIMELEEAGRLGQIPGSVLVLGAGGGAGSAAVAILAQLGFHVVASTGRVEQLTEYLTGLGASEVIGRLEATGLKKPLQEQRWAAVVDCAGGPALGSALAQLKFQGAAACIGVAGGSGLDSTIFPFVLRGIRLLGVDSTLPWNVAGLGEDPAEWQRNRDRRVEIWRRMTTDLPVEALHRMHEATIPMEELPAWGDKLLSGGVRGRVVVRVAG